MGLDIAFNPPQFGDEYDGYAMRTLVEEIERLTAIDIDSGGAATWDRTGLEIINGIIPTDESYAPGWTFRYGAVADASTDDTAAIQEAIDSGHTVFFNEGRYAVEGTLLVGSDGGLIGGKHLVMSSQVRLERFTNVTTPVIQVYGVQNRIEGNGAQLASRTYASDNAGIFLLGQDPDATLISEPDQIATQHNWISDLKIIGQTDTLGNDGSIGFYVNSAARRRGDWISPNITTFYNTMSGIYVTKCDKSFELSTDSNANSFIGCTALNFGEAAIMLNAAYGNSFTNVRIESPISVSTTRRYAIHFGEKNYSVSGETGSHADYPIHGALNNNIHGWAELRNTGNFVVSLFTIIDPPSGTSPQYGQNFIRVSGIQPAGLGTDGLTTEEKIFDTVIDTDTTFANHHRVVQYPGNVKWKRLDDDSGGIRFETSSARLSGRKASMSEDFTYDLFSIDNVGATSSSVLISLFFDCKESVGNDHVAGNIVWLCPVAGNSARTPVEVYRHFGHYGIDEEPSIVPIVVESAGTATNTGKFTVKLATQTLGVTSGNSFCGWSANITNANLEGTNLDWSNDVKLLTSSTSGLVKDTMWASKTKVALADEVRNNTNTLTDHGNLNSWDLEPNTEYLITAEIVAKSDATPDLKLNFDFSSATQNVSIAGFTANTLGVQQVLDGASMFFPGFGSLLTPITLMGVFKTNATTGGDVSLRFAQNTANASDTTIFTGSWVKIVRVDSVRNEVL